MSANLIYWAAMALLGILGYIGRSHMNRIENIEKDMDTKINEVQARQILQDKLEPVKEGLDEVRAKLDKLYDLLLK